MFEIPRLLRVRLARGVAVSFERALLDAADYTE
jgi:hypothetical protein